MTPKIIAFIFIVISLHTQAQFTVISLQGSVTKNGEALKIGSHLQSEHFIQFAAENSRLILVDDSLGFFQAESFDPEAELGDCLMPFNTKHRGFKRKAQAVRNLKIYFGPDLFTIIGDSLDIPLDSEQYPLNSEKFIVFHYKINGEQQSKKIAFENQHLKIRKSDLFQGKSEVFSGDVLRKINIYSFEPSTRTSVKITQIDLCFVPQSRFVAECNVLKQIGRTKQIEPELLEHKIDQYIYGRYGTADPKQLSTTLSQLQP